MISSTAPTTLQNSGNSLSLSPSHRERDDDYANVVLHFDPRWRVIICKGGIQWIIQKKEASHAGPWRGISYHVGRSSLIRTCGSLNLLSAALEEQLLDAIPSSFREYAKERSRP